MRWLFICSKNQWRSPTAEKVFRRQAGVEVRSAGTSPGARRRVTEGDLHWADQIFVMEHKHKAQLIARFGDWVSRLPIDVLGIPDEYRYMDPELIDLLKEGVEGFVEG
jgi:predicted protein tyrosine phosphatase